METEANSMFGTAVACSEPRQVAAAREQPMCTSAIDDWKHRFSYYLRSGDSTDSDEAVDLPSPTTVLAGVCQDQTPAPANWKRRIWYYITHGVPLERDEPEDTHSPTTNLAAVGHFQTDRTLIPTCTKL